MDTIKNITPDLYYLGCNDRRVELFENVYPVSNGVSYNSYFLDDSKTVLLDTVDKCCSIQFFKNLTSLLKGRNLDYLIVNHLEPDHSALIEEVIKKYPDVTVVCNLKIKQMLFQFFEFENDIENNFHIVKEGDILDTGRHKLTFVMAPMVHWPEVMVTYDTVDKILFSADAFGSFGALSGNIIDSDTDFDCQIPEYRRYYTNIVGKYGPQVTNLLNKAKTLDIKLICPLHGLIIKENILKLVELYSNWASYTPEISSALVVYASVYGSTQIAAEKIADELALKGVKNIKVYDVSKTHSSFILAEAFKYSHIVLASTTYNNNVFVKMEQFINDLIHHNLQKRTFAIIENGSWAPKATQVIKEMLGKIPNTKVLENSVTIQSSPKKAQESEFSALAEQIAKDIL